MLRIYPVVLEVIADVRPMLVQIERRDSDLARQLKRAASSVARSLAEGMYSRGNRLARYHNALGSMRETRACLEVASAFGYQCPQHMVEPPLELPLRGEANSSRLPSRSTSCFPNATACRCFLPPPLLNMCLRTHCDPRRPSFSTCKIHCS